MERFLGLMDSLYCSIGSFEPIATLVVVFKLDSFAQLGYPNPSGDVETTCTLERLHIWLLMAQTRFRLPIACPICGWFWEAFWGCLLSGNGRFLLRRGSRPCSSSASCTFRNRCAVISSSAWLEWAWQPSSLASLCRRRCFRFTFVWSLLFLAPCQAFSLSWPTG